MDFEGMTPQQAAEKITERYDHPLFGGEQCKRIVYFSPCRTYRYWLEIRWASGGRALKPRQPWTRASLDRLDTFSLYKLYWRYTHSSEDGGFTHRITSKELKLIRAALMSREDFSAGRARHT